MIHNCLHHWIKVDQRWCHTTSEGSQDVISCQPISHVSSRSFIPFTIFVLEFLHHEPARINALNMYRYDTAIAVAFVYGAMGMHCIQCYVFFKRCWLYCVHLIQISRGYILSLQMNWMRIKRWQFGWVALQINAVGGSCVFFSSRILLSTDGPFHYSGIKRWWITICASCLLPCSQQVVAINFQRLMMFG